MASRPWEAILWSQAGGSSKAEMYGKWWAASPSYLDNQDGLMKKWDKEFGDRMNELVIIGTELDKTQITDELQKCLLNTDEMKEWRSKERFEDPWPL